jgi:hypothetical protein
MNAIRIGLNFKTALVAACTLFTIPTVAFATPVAVFTGTFTGIAYDSAHGSGRGFDGTMVTGTFYLNATGTGDYSSPTYTNSVIEGGDFSLTVVADGQTLAFSDLYTTYFLNTYFPAGASESEIEVAHTLPDQGASLDFYGDILKDSFPSDMKTGAIDLSKSSITFSQGDIKADLKLTTVTFSDGKTTSIPEPSTLPLALLASIALALAIQRRRGSTK